MYLTFVLLSVYAQKRPKPIESETYASDERQANRRTNIKRRWMMIYEQTCFKFLGKSASKVMPLLSIFQLHIGGLQACIAIIGQPWTDSLFYTFALTFMHDSICVNWKKKLKRAIAFSMPWRSHIHQFVANSISSISHFFVSFVSVCNSLICVWFLIGKKCALLQVDWKMCTVSFKMRRIAITPNEQFVLSVLSSIWYNWAQQYNWLQSPQMKMTTKQIKCIDIVTNYTNKPHRQKQRQGTTFLPSRDDMSENQKKRFI